MRTLQHFLGTLWAIWASFWFLLVVLIFTPLYAIVLGLFGRRFSMHCVWINCHYLSPFLLFISGIRLKVYGKEKINPNRKYVFVANHCAMIDIIATASAVPQPIRFLSKAEVKYIPLFGFMVRMLAIIVDRQSKESREKSYRYMVAALQKGESLFLYPEGTRNRTAEPLKDFKDGAFKVAVLAQAPIAVQTLLNTGKLNNPRRFYLWPGTVEVHWGQPIETTGMTTADIPRLKEMVRAEMLKHLA